MARPTKRPRVSVVLPFHSDKVSLAAAVESVLAQTLQDFELLIVDDGSKEVDAIVELDLRDDRIEITRHGENRGVAAARNTGISRARGDYVAFLDSDDVWHADKLERQLAWMNSGDCAQAISCTAYRIVTPFRPQGELRWPQAEVRFRDLLWGCGISPGSTMMAKRGLLETVGAFDESLRRLEDWDWLLRCAHITPIGGVPAVLAEIDTGPRDECPLEQICEAAAIIEDYAAANRYRLTGGQRNILLSTLHTEVAAAAFRRRQYRRAARSFMRALYHRPPTRTVYYRRILRAVKSDFMQAFASRRAPKEREQRTKQP